MTQDIAELKRVNPMRTPRNSVLAKLTGIEATGDGATGDRVSDML